jgi:hypothetical protein
MMRSAQAILRGLFNQSSQAPWGRLDANDFQTSFGALAPDLRLRVAEAWPALNPDGADFADILNGLDVAPEDHGKAVDAAVAAGTLTAERAASMTTMMAGRIDLMFDNLSASLKHIESGRLKALAVSPARRAPSLPQVPTVTESGVAAFDGESWMALFAPSATPPAVVDRLRALLLEVVADADFGARVVQAGGRVMSVPAAQQEAFLKSETERLGRLIRQHGVTVE